MMARIREQGAGGLLVALGFGLVLLGCLELAEGAQGKCFPAIFNFGDSTSDSGGIHVAFPLQTPAEFPPYGDTFPGKPTNKYSDGRLLIDFVAQGLGLQYLSSAMEPTNSDFSYGANFATAGATVMPVTYLSPFPLPVQYLQFFRFYRDVVALRSDPNTPAKMLARIPTLEAFSTGLYTIALGGNDFTFGYTHGQTINEVEKYLPLVADGITQTVKMFYSVGGRNFIVWDIEPHGCLPYFLTFVPHTDDDLDANGCLIDYNDAAQRFNDMLRVEFAKVREELPDINLHLLSTFDIKANLAGNLTANGFKHDLEACCGVPSKHNYHLDVNCGKSKTIRNVTYTAVKCENPNEYTVWDGVHNTEAANRFVAKQMFTGEFFDVPYTELFENCPIQSIE